jgi:hypothetical protein
MLKQHELAKWHCLMAATMEPVVGIPGVHADILSLAAHCRQMRLVLLSALGYNGSQPGKYPPNKA